MNTAQLKPVQEEVRSITGLRNVDIVATLGPKSLAPTAMKALVEQGASILRINGSHLCPENIELYARKIREFVGDGVRILVDLPGNKVRTKNLSDPIPLKIGEWIELYRQHVSYGNFFDVLKEEEELLANDGLIRFDVVKILEDKIILKCKTDGELGNNKGLHALGNHGLPFLLDKDYEILDLARRTDIDYVGVSFVRKPDDVEKVRGLLKDAKARPLVKIETKEALANLDAILDVADQILIDRGDLCADIGYVNIPHAQAVIMKKAKEKGVKVGLATQFLHSMLTRDVPLIAEVEAIFHAVKSGASFVQLSEETAVGHYPDQAVSVVANMIREALRPI